MEMHSKQTVYNFQFRQLFNRIRFCESRFYFTFNSSFWDFSTFGIVNVNNLSIDFSVLRVLHENVHSPLRFPSLDVQPGQFNEVLLLNSGAHSDDSFLVDVPSGELLVQLRVEGGHAALHARIQFADGHRVHPVVRRVFLEALLLRQNRSLVVSDRDRRRLSELHQLPAVVRVCCMASCRRSTWHFENV